MSRKRVLNEIGFEKGNKRNNNSLIVFFLFLRKEKNKINFKNVI